MIHVPMQQSWRHQHEHVHCNVNTDGYMQSFILMRIHTRQQKPTVSSFRGLGGPRSNDSLVAANTSCAQMLPSCNIIQEKEPGFLGKRIDCRREARKHKRCLKHPAVLGRKKAPKHQTKPENPRPPEIRQWDKAVSSEGAQWPKRKQFWGTKQKRSIGSTFLVVQGLKLHPLNGRGSVRSLVRKPGPPCCT